MPIGYSMWLGPAAMAGITGTIITLNEEARIAEAIASLSCCDEIIVVDAGSNDRTREIAHARGARVIERSWQGYSDQKNFAADQADNDWILSVDADERLSVELANEIVQWKRTQAAPYLQAWAMPRRAFYLGRWINHSGWYPDPKIRLYNRRQCHWEGDSVHESLKVEGQVAGFTGDLLHFPYRDWSDHVRRIERYSELAAKAARAKGSRSGVLRFVLAPPLTFLKTLLLQGGVLDGWRGWAISYMAARYVLRRQLRILR